MSVSHRKKMFFGLKKQVILGRAKLWPYQKSSDLQQRADGNPWEAGVNEGLEQGDKLRGAQSEPWASWLRWGAGPSVLQATQVPVLGAAEASQYHILPQPRPTAAAVQLRCRQDAALPHILAVTGGSALLSLFEGEFLSQDFIYFPMH